MKRPSKFININTKVLIFVLTVFCVFSIILSSIFSKEYNYAQVLEKLREDTDRYFAQWHYAPKLREELVLLLDENLCAKLNNYDLYYDKKTGLSCREEEKNENTGI